MNKCPGCGANFPETSFVCEYCGHVIAERVKTVDSKSGKEISFSESMNVIEDNLNALYEIHPPSAGKTLSKIFRIIFAFHTLGFILIFWRKPKTKFDSVNYKKLKSIVQRNILKLKMSSAGSNQLLGQIKIVEQEMAKIDKSIKNGFLYRNLVVVAVIAIYLIFIFATNN